MIPFGELGSVKSHSSKSASRKNSLGWTSLGPYLWCSARYRNTALARLMVSPVQLVGSAGCWQNDLLLQGQTSILLEDVCVPIQATNPLWFTNRRAKVQRRFCLPYTLVGRLE